MGLFVHILLTNVTLSYAISLPHNFLSASTHYFVPYYPFGYYRRHDHDAKGHLPRIRHTGAHRRQIQIPDSVAPVPEKAAVQ